MNNIYITVLGVITLLAPFAHIFVNQSKEGILGYPYMASFLFAIGFPLAFISVGVMLHYCATKMESDFKKGFSFISYMIVAIGGFYIAWSLIPAQDFTRVTYYGTLVSLTIVLVIAIKYLNKAVITAEEQLKGIIRMMNDWAIIHLPESLKRYTGFDTQEYYEEDVAPMLKKQSDLIR